MSNPLVIFEHIQTIGNQTQALKASPTLSNNLSQAKSLIIEISKPPKVQKALKNNIKGR